MQLVFGAALTPYGGPYEAARGRLVIYQELIPCLDGADVSPEPIFSRLYGPKEILEDLRVKLGLEYDPDNGSESPCLLYNGETGPLLALVQSHIPDLETLNADDDKVRAMLELAE